MNFRIQQYISDKHREVFENALESDNNTLIVSPTDSGKTYSVIEYAKSNPHKRIAFIMPVQNLVNNIKEKYQGKAGNNIICGYGKTFAYTNAHHNFICTTYDTYLMFQKAFDIVIIDEAHILASHGNFRTSTIAPLLEIKQKTVLLSGTPEVVEHLSGFQKIEFTRKQRKKHVDLIPSTTSAKHHAIDLLQDHKGSSVLMIRLNNKSTLDELYELFKTHHNIVKVYSDSDKVLYCGQNEDEVNEMKKGNVPESINVILCTSIFDTGVSFKVNRDIRCYAVEDYRMPNPIDMVQLLARVRSGSHNEMSLSIIGKFGDFALWERMDIGSAPTQKQRVKQMAELYAEYSELDEENYLSILDYYNVRADIRLPDEKKITNPKYLSKLKKIQIVNNFNNFPELYTPIKNELQDQGRIECIELITGNDVILSTPNAEAMRLYEQLMFATRQRIPFNSFIGKKYEEQRIKNFMGAYDKYYSCEHFAGVVNQITSHSDIPEGQKVKIDLTEYHDLDKPSQGYVREIARLYFKQVKFMKDRNSVKLVRENTSGFDSYLVCFGFVKQVA